MRQDRETLSTPTASTLVNSAFSGIMATGLLPQEVDVSITSACFMSLC